ncbi:MAG: phosphatidate cytidylyltransferase [Turicibacter sp.]
MSQRLITAIVIIAIALPILIYGKLPFIALGIFLTLVAVQEMIDMKETVNKAPIEIKILTMFATLMVVFSGFDIYSQTFTGVLDFGIGTISFFLFFLMVTLVTRKGFTVNDAGFYLLTILYIGATFHSMLYLRFVGISYFLFMLIVVAVGDSGAYFFGRKFGRRKLAPVISPKKTVEGAIGGTLLAVTIGTIFGLVTGISTSVISLILISLIISIVGQFGDLVASSMKRNYEIKDFGTLFPGHGGVLDRLDSHLFASMALYILMNMMNVGI